MAQLETGCMILSPPVAFVRLPEIRWDGPVKQEQPSLASDTTNLFNNTHAMF